MGHYFTKLTNCLLLAVVLFCAGILPFAPQTDDSDDNFGIASVIVVTGRSHGERQNDVRPSRARTSGRAVVTVRGDELAAVMCEPVLAVVQAISSPSIPLRT